MTLPTTLMILLLKPLEQLAADNFAWMPKINERKAKNNNRKNVNQIDYYSDFNTEGDQYQDTMQTAQQNWWISLNGKCNLACIKKGRKGYI